MNVSRNNVQVIDSHTGGEPTRIVTAGGPDLGPGTVAQRREVFGEEHDAFRSAVINEPRGSDVLVGGILCEPVGEDSCAGVIFFNNVGTLHMCGHGMIGLITTLAHMGRIGPGDHRIETPVGDVVATLHEDQRVSFRNVPSYRYRQDVAIEVPGYGQVVGDIAWGGNWFFLVKQHAETIAYANVARLTEVTGLIRQALIEQEVTGENQLEIDHIELYGPPSREDADSKSFVLCPGGAYDRSPCGTGTSAKVACLAADGTLSPGQVWRQESIVGSLFEATVEMSGDQLIPVITGSAYVHAEATLLFHPDDPFQSGIRS
jgi:4-hydroxyproline epimerase